MGVCVSAEVKRNHEIEKEQKAKAKLEKRKVKLLLLGPGESGKSTVLKQMKMIRLNGFDKVELLEYRPLVFSNITTSISILIQAMTDLRIEYELATAKHNANTIMAAISAGKMHEQPTAELLEVISNVWNDQGVQDCYQRRNQFHLNDSAKYFLDDLNRISNATYVPTEDDTLRVRVHTTGVVEMIFNWKSLTFRVIDVGGQRSERRKWMHQFENVDCILFVVALSEYDQNMREDDSTNRMTDSLQVFATICGERYFHDSEFILFLNKRDLFKEKIVRTPITESFPEYKGSQTYEESIRYIVAQFTTLNKNERRSINVHETCATDKNQMQVVIEAVLEVVLAKNMNKTGLII